MTPSLQPRNSAKHPPQIIHNDSLVLQDMLGVGAYGSVYKAYDQVSRQMRAIKCIRTAGLDSRQRAFQGHEAELHSLVSGHPNIATLHEVVEEDDFFYMIMDCGLEGDLFSKITERGGYVGKDRAIKSIFGQITGAVMHCHSKGVFHRDLKPENIIIFGDAVKLVDFGLATTEPISSDFGCGSTFYLSPECQGGYVERVTSFDSAANDVWSLGVILINLVFGRNPWKQACPRDETFSAFVLNNDFLQTILPMSDELNEIIKSVFCLNPRKRLSLPEFARRVQGCSSFTTAVESPTASSSSPRAAAAAAAAAGTTGAEQTTPIRFHFGHDALLCNSRDNKAQSQGQDSGVCVELHSVA
ncbi:hypothetical protein BGZ96_001113 [Linnemannia gamsii]|uniref:Protein kinase domain-containing protein n=1 Tax=Linnemannia gamsii TaxID=64522 RepID=A0ABQ7JMS1_9FUNG|nr:hypothetical protein BGZ96_001113 [Linnemannia gamsii]